MGNGNINYPSIVDLIKKPRPKLYSIVFPIISIIVIDIGNLIEKKYSNGIGTSLEVIGLLSVIVFGAILAKMKSRKPVFAWVIICLVLSIFGLIILSFIPNLTKNDSETKPKEGINQNHEQFESTTKETLNGSNYNNFPQKVFIDFFSFSGRIGRIEYALSLVISAFVLFYGEAIIRTIDIFHFIFLDLIISLLVIFAICWFIIAQGVKRCHDRNSPGWYLIFTFYIFWILFAKGDEGLNSYGEAKVWREKL